MGFRFTDSRFTVTADGFTGYCLSGYRFMGERFAWHRLTGNRFTGYQIIALRATQTVSWVIAPCEGAYGRVPLELGMFCC